MLTKLYASPRRALATAAALACCAAPAFALAAQAGASTITSGDCGIMGAHQSCTTDSVSYNGNRRTLFRLANGGGVDHLAYLYDTVGEGTGQDVYSGCVNINTSIAGRGENNSASQHHYLIYQVTGC